MSKRHKSSKMRGTRCPCCSTFACNGKHNERLAKMMRKLGQKRRFTKAQDGW
jgi:hypothetical protein